jgi:hypothetical protein
MTSRRIHRAFPRSPSASSPRPGAFEARAFAQPTVQRFTVVQPGVYQAAQQLSLPSQVLDTSRTTAPSQGRTQVTQKLSWENRTTQNPPLRVSERGQLAMESTAGQAKVFYATAAAAAANRERLIDIGSRITLKADANETVQVPRDPKNIDDNTVTLVQVEPERSPDFVNEDELMDTNECDSVSQRIVQGKEAVIGNTQEGFELAGSVSARRGDINHVAKAIHGTNEDEPLDTFAQKVQLSKARLPDLYSLTLPISEEVQKYFAEGFWRRDHLVPSPSILRALSLPGVPKSLWDQIYELHVDKTEEERPTAGLVLAHIKRALHFPGVSKYQKVRNDAQRNERLGVNEDAAPEVGESFSTMSQTSPMVVDANGVLSHDLDVSTMNDDALPGVYEELLALRGNAERLGTLAVSQYQRAQGVVPYQEHHAAVVAKDGDDTVTFENYNRTGEADTLKTDLWEKLLNDFDDFGNGVEQNIQEVKDNGDDAVSKLNAITRIRKQHLETMRQNFVEVQGLTDLKVESNLGEINHNDLWHFSMYGPASEGQSFHQVWSPAVANAITVRTTGEAGDFFKNRLATSIGDRATQLANTENGRLALLAGLLDPIREAETRIEASDAYRRALAALETRAVEQPEDKID